jgi:hypothetical protein
MLASPHNSVIWPVVLTTTGVLAASVILTVTNDVIRSAIALLVTFVTVRRFLQHR